MGTKVKGYHSGATCDTVAFEEAKSLTATVPITRPTLTEYTSRYTGWVSVDMNEQTTENLISTFKDMGDKITDEKLRELAQLILDELDRRS